MFYDDFTVICKKRLCHGTGIAAEALFDLFGMWFAKDGSKANPFGDLVRTLGLQVRLGSVTQGFCIGHTEERRAELKAALQDVLGKGTIEPKQGCEDACSGLKDMLLEELHNSALRYSETLPYENKNKLN